MRLLPEFIFRQVLPESGSELTYNIYIYNNNNIYPSKVMYDTDKNMRSEKMKQYYLGPRGHREGLASEGLFTVR
jgi:hypothetical protein